MEAAAAEHHDEELAFQRVIFRNRKKNCCFVLLSKSSFALTQLPIGMLESIKSTKSNSPSGS